MSDLSSMIAHAEAGDPEAQYELGNVFFFSWMANVYKLKRNPQDAAEWYLKAAKQGHAGAQCQLGYIFAETGNRRYQEWASDLFALSAKSKDPIAMMNLGKMFAEGKGVPENPQLAKEWFIEAAVRGNAQEKYDLAFMYEYGMFGLEGGLSSAVQWYERAADEKHVDAMIRMAELYLTGKHVKQSIWKSSELLQEVAKLDPDL